MEQKPFDFKGLSKEIFANWKIFFRDNFIFTKVINTKEISDPIVSAIQDKEIPVVSPDEISKPIVDALYKVQESIDNKEGVEEVSVKNIEQAKTDITEVVSVLKEIRDKEDVAFPEIPEPKESVKIDGEVTISEPVWWKQTDLSETNEVLKKIEEKKYPEFPKFPEFPSFSDIFQKAIAPIKDILEKILLKPERKNPPFEFDDFGRVKVNVDRAGGGGGNGGLTDIESTAIQTIAGMDYDTTSVDMADPSNIVITYLLDGILVATETITKTGTTYNIVKS